MKTFANLEIPSKIVYGPHALQELGKAAASLGKKALVVSDRIMEKTGYVAQCCQLLEEAGLTWAAYLDANSEPTLAFVRDALDICIQEDCDLVVTIGGGSCLDTAKAVAVLATNGGQIGDYVGGKTLAANLPLPLIAIPTTAGTGSEVTNVTVITDTEQDIKMMIKQSAFLPRVAIVDPLLTLSAPKKVTAATGLDALCHAVEAYLSKRAHPMTDTFALSAIELISQNIKQAYDQGDDLEARQKMALGSMQAGIAFSNASVTLVHGMSRPIGALFHVPHGISNAMLLPAVLEFSKKTAVEALAVIGKTMDPQAPAVGNEAWADVAINRIKELCVHLEIPNLKTWGINADQFARVLDKMATDALASGSPGNHPYMPSHGEIVDLYQVCYHYVY